MSDEHAGPPPNPPPEPPPAGHHPPEPVPPSPAPHTNGPPASEAARAEARPATAPNVPPAPRRGLGRFFRRSPQEAAKPQQPISTTREVLETIVFVVVLVLLLKTFSAEAFVIPTGSMATTLLGYNKPVTCPKCGTHFVVNCSKEVDPQESQPAWIVGGVCPNCRFHFPLGQDISWSSGDRVLVAKFIYDTRLARPERYQVVVFKYPQEPVSRSHVPTNFIKRLIGLPGDTLLVYYGQLYLIHGMDFADQEKPDDPSDLWKIDYTYRKTYHGPEVAGQDLIETIKREYRDRHGKELKIDILRKPPEVMLALRRLVYDNDHPADDLKGLLPPRWAAADGKVWQEDDRHGFVAAADTPAVRWLRYRHIVPPDPRPERAEMDRKPELITDFSSYNTFNFVLKMDGVTPQWPGVFHMPAPNWVGDLMLEARVTVTEAKGDLWLELSRGVDRFRARWQLETGRCTLYRVGESGKLRELASKDTTVNRPGDYRVRFANFDQRLTVWVDKATPFDAGVVYDPPGRRGPTRNDLEPASIGVRGAKVEVHELKLWRNTYYTVNVGEPQSDAGREPDRDEDRRHEIWSNPGEWSDLRKLPALRMYVQPGHYLCLGDNSPESSDSRSWGVVPWRLLLGRALLVYYPVGRAGPIK